MLKTLMNPPINLNRNSCIIVKQVYWQFFLKSCFLGIREMAQSLMCLLHQREDLSLDKVTTSQKWATTQ